MEYHELIKMVHAGAASLALIVLIGRAILLWVVGDPANISRPVRGIMVGLQHLTFTILIVLGIILLVQNQFEVQPWFYAKIILFLVVLSATHKAFGKRDIELIQRKAGVVIAVIAFIGIIGLVLVKPSLGKVGMTSTATQVTTAPETVSSPK